MFEFATVKENTRYYTYPRGCGAGGSTNNHAMYDGRGTPVIYDKIAKFVKNKLWSYENILQYYKKMENYQINKLNPDLHGYTGWLPINTTGPIDKDLRGEIIGLLDKKYNVPYRTDPADPKQVTGAYLPETQGKDNVRANAFKNLLTPLLPTCPNITVKFNSQVGKIIIKKYKSKKSKSKSKLRAIGVEVYEKPYIQEYNITGNKLNANCDAVIPNKDLPPITKYYARKEVIICGGSINTPQILLLSGLGSKEDLKSVGIKCLVDLPGVGKNLMDHLEANVMFDMDPAKFMWEWQATYFKYNTDYKNLSPVPIQRTIEKYANSSNNIKLPFCVIWDWIVNKGSKPDFPDVHVALKEGFVFDYNLNFIKVPGDDYHEKQTKYDTYMPDIADPLSYPGVKGLKQFYITNINNPKNPSVLLTFLIENLKINKTPGYIKLKSKDPRDSPIIFPDMIADEKALETNAKMMFLVRDFMKSPEMLKYAKDPNNYDTYEVVPGTKIQTMEDMIQYQKNWSASGHHMGGTCRMGPPGDKMAVTNSVLQVNGVSGLRIVDASVYPAPNLHAYNTSRGVYMIGELMSDVILSKYKNKL
jgi:choline dehydrogenase